MGDYTVYGEYCYGRVLCESSTEGRIIFGEITVWRGPGSARLLCVEINVWEEYMVVIGRMICRNNVLC